LKQARHEPHAIRVRFFYASALTQERGPKTRETGVRHAIPGNMG